MAPFIAALLKSGLGLVANAALVKGKEWVEEQTGVKLGEEYTPEQLTQIKQWELQHEQFLLQLRHEENRLDKEIEIAYLNDRQDARKMQMHALSQDDLFSKRFIYYFAIGTMLFAGAYIAAITFGEIPEDNQQYVNTILGFLLGTLVSAIFQFFFGSSKNAQYAEGIVDQVVVNSIKGNNHVDG